MAGILANSASVTMVSGTANNTQAGYLVGEQITLSTNPTGSIYSWGESIPSGSSSAKSALSSTTEASPRFTPDVAGEYVVTVTVDSTTTYVLRCSVTAAPSVALVSTMRLLPVLDANVPIPATGVTLFYSSDDDVMKIRKPDGTYATVTTS
jgi:hypothetical protein